MRTETVKSATRTQTKALAPVNVDDKLKELAKQASPIQIAAQKLVVKNEASLAQASTLLVQIAKVKKQIEDARLFLVKPLKDHIKTIEAKFKGQLEPYEVLDQQLRDKVLDFRNAEAAKARVAAEAREREQEEAARKAEGLAAKAAKAKGKKAEVLAEQAQEAQEAAIALSVPSEAETVAVPSMGISTKKRWTFEVTDTGAVPAAYRIVDPGLIRLAIRQGVREIPGVRIFEEESLAVPKGG